MSRVDQLLDGFVPADAISRDALALRQQLRQLGYQSDLFAVADRISPDGRADCRPLSELSTAHPDAAILHYAIASPAAEVWRRGTFRRLLLYHNITPAEWFRPYDCALAAQLDAGRRLLPELVAAAHSLAAVSSFNAHELQQMGAAAVRVLPLALTAIANVSPDPILTRRLGDGFTNILHVGRLVPNKCLEELIEAFTWYHRAFNPRSRLLIVGSDRACPRYGALLRMLIVEYQAETVWLTGYLDHQQLAAAYAAASLVVTVSRHEGFCAPLLDAARARVPVLARAIGGIPEAVGAGALLYDEASPRELAVLIHLATRDGALRDHILEGQRMHLAELERRTMDQELLEWLGSAGVPLPVPLVV